MSRRNTLIAAGVVVVLILGWYVVLWRPAVAGSNRASAAKDATEAQQVTLASQFAGLEVLQRTLVAQEVKLRQAEIAVPTTASLADVIEQLDGIAKSDRIVWSNESQSLGAVLATTAPTTTVAAPASSSTATTAVATAGIATPAAADSTLLLTLNVAGTYGAMTKYITDVEHLPRLIVIDTLNYSPATTGQITVSMTARAFYNPTPEPALPKTGT
jgi:Tfp pilus assembly protein PilO